ncbi:unnamed protein product, partial [Vitis vinifera]
MGLRFLLKYLKIYHLSGPLTLGNKYLKIFSISITKITGVFLQWSPPFLASLTKRNPYWSPIPYPFCLPKKPFSFC